MSDLDLNEIYHFAIKLAKDVRPRPGPPHPPTRDAEIFRPVI